MIQKIKTLGFMFCVAVFTCFASYSPLLFADDTTNNYPVTPTPTTLVSTSGIQSSILNEIVNWLGIGLAVAISVYVVYVGWRMMRRFLGN